METKVGITESEYNARILLVENDPGELTSWTALLVSEGYQVIAESSLAGARKALTQKGRSIQVIVTDLHLADDTDQNDDTGLELVRDFGGVFPVIVLTGFPTLDAVLKSLGRQRGLPGALEFIRKQSDGPRALLRAVEKAVAQHAQGLQRQIGGALTDNDAAVYVTRGAELEIARRLKRMEYLLVIEPRQQGKTSLVNFLIRNPPSSQSVVAYVDMSTLQTSSEEAWYGNLNRRLRRQLTCLLPALTWPTAPRDSGEWRDFVASLADSFRELGRLLIIALDEIGTPVPEATRFFGVLRDVYNSRQAEISLRNLTFILLGAFHPRELVSDNRVSPFNVAHRVRLPDFSLVEVTTLVKRIVPSDVRATLLAAHIYSWTGGQPYLTQQLCAFLRADSAAEQVSKDVDQVRRDDENHLPPLLKALGNYPDGVEYVLRILRGESIRFSPAEITVQAKLELLGIIASDENGLCAIRNRMYRNALEPLNYRIRSFDTRTLSMEVDNSIVEANAILGARGSKTRILFLAADPSDLARLRLGEEARAIDEQLKRSKMRRRFLLSQRFAVRPFDLSQALFEERPHIVHFSGHGESTGELCFQDESGKSQVITPAFLVELLSLIAKDVRCVVLNACYSQVQANAISECVDYVIGMSSVIGDRAAIAFSRGFYQALGEGMSFADAFRHGRIHCGIAARKGEPVVVLLTREGRNNQR
jgi:CheY-like chemotaxis protein